MLYFSHKKQTSKNVADTTFKADLFGVVEWFKIHSMIANPDKFQFIVLGNKDEGKRSFNIHINNVKLKTQTK